MGIGLAKPRFFGEARMGVLYKKNVNGYVRVQDHLVHELPAGWSFAETWNFAFFGFVGIEQVIVPENNKAAEKEEHQHLILYLKPFQPAWLLEFCIGSEKIKKQVNFHLPLWLEIRTGISHQ